jgi:D-amino-acid dehydrogenase
MSQVVIIGAGIIGVCSALYAARRGFSVTVLDRASAEHEGCSFGNAGLIVPSHFIPLAAPGAVAQGLKWMLQPDSPFWIKPRLDLDLLNWGWKFWQASNAEQARRAAPVLRDLHLASRDCYLELAEECGNEFGLVQRGLLALCKTEHALAEESKMAEQARALGIPAEVLSASDIARIEPELRLDAAGAVYFPRDCHLSPNRLMRRLRARARELGVVFEFGTEVAGVRSESGRVRALLTNKGEFAADNFVLCGGSWSPVLAREFKLKLPMQAGKGYSLTLENPPKLPKTCSILVEARVAVTPMGEALRLGGTMEMGGLNQTINFRRVEAIVNALPAYYPDFDSALFRNIRPWQGLRPVTPDGLPYLGRTRHLPNLIVATGHAMLGLSLGPVTGKLVVEILSGESPSIPIQLLDPNRYS